MGACHSTKNHIRDPSDIGYGKSMSSYDLDYNMFSSYSIHSIAKNEDLHHHKHQKHKKRKKSSTKKRKKKRRHQYNSSGWRRLRSLPVKKAKSKTLHPIKINNEEYVMIQTSIIYENGHIPMLHKYNNTINKWCVLCEYPTDYPSGYLYTAALDTFSSILYIWIGSYIITYSLENNLWTKHPIIRNFDCGNDPCSIAINDEFHIIGVDEHLIWDSNKKILIQMSLPYSLEYFDKPSIYHWNNKFLLIGQEFNIQTGHDAISCLGNNDFHATDDQQCSSDSVYQYDISNKEWTKMEEIALPNYNTGGILNVDLNGILLFGGQYNNKMSDDRDLDNIYEIRVSDVDPMDPRSIQDNHEHCCKSCMMRKSRVKCPRQALYFALLMKSDLHQKWIINGFMRRDCYWKSVMWVPSNDIIDLIGKYYCMHYVLLIDKYNGSQWRIYLDCIENKLQECDYHTVTRSIDNAF